MRYRTCKLVEGQAAERNRLLKLLETANIKLPSVRQRCLRLIWRHEILRNEILSEGQDIPALQGGGGGGGGGGRAAGGGGVGGGGGGLGGGGWAWGFVGLGGWSWVCLGWVVVVVVGVGGVVIGPNSSRCPPCS